MFLKSKDTDSKVSGIGVSAGDDPNLTVSQGHRSFRAAFNESVE